MESYIIYIIESNIMHLQTMQDHVTKIHYIIRMGVCMGIKSVHKKCHVPVQCSSVHLLGIQRVAIFDETPDRQAFQVELDEKTYSYLTMVQWCNHNALCMLIHI